MMLCHVSCDQLRTYTCTPTGKSAAKRWCALEAVCLLHQAHALDDHLRPVGLALPQDGKPANAALAEKIMDRGEQRHGSEIKWLVLL